MANQTLINFYHSTIQGKLLDAKASQDLDRVAFQLGYIISPEAHTEDVMDFIHNQHIDLTSTFYKTWESVVSRNRFEILLDQLTHYFLSGVTSWTPEDKDVIEPGTPIIEFDKYTYIDAISIDEMIEKVLGTLKSGIALSTQVVNELSNFLYEMHNSESIGFSINKVLIDTIKNRECKVILCQKAHMFPSRAEDIIKCINYFATGSAMYVKNKENLLGIRCWAFNHPELNDYLTEDVMEELAKSFFRYKKAILALREAGDEVKTKINKIRRMASKMHEPMHAPFWNTVLSTEYPDMLITGHIDTLNMFQLVKLYQATQQRMMLIEDGGGDELFIIRNGKMYITRRKLKSVSLAYLDNLSNILMQELISRMKKKLAEKNIKYVSFPKVNIACPTSEKNFVGEYPFGSSIDMGDKDVVFGIYWKEEWGTRDFDLSYVDFEGRRVGWNAGWSSNNNDVVFSGDMVRAVPEATELMYCARGCRDGIIYNNRFSGQENSKFKFIVAREHCEEFGLGYMVHPEHILVNATMTSVKRQTQVGLILDNRVYFMELDLGNCRVSGGINDIEIKKLYKRIAKSSLDLRALLLRAGAKDSDKLNRQLERREIITPDLDLNDISKNDLIELFS